MCFCLLCLLVCLFGFVGFFFFSIHESHTGSVAFFFLQDTWATTVSHLRDLLLQIVIYVHIHSELVREWERAESKHAIHLCFLYVSYIHSAGNLIQCFIADTFWPPVTHEIRCGMFHPQQHVSAQKLENLKLWWILTSKMSNTVP